MVSKTFLGLTLVLITSGSSILSAQPPEPRDRPAADNWNEFRLGTAAAAPTASERRAAAEAAALERRQRAAFHAHQRALRSEFNAWMGATPLRPSWPSVPYTHSYYGPQRIIYVPVFVD